MFDGNGSITVEASAAFATAAHGAAGQVRKYTGAPYIEHPAAVATLVREAGGDDGMIAAAWLHDVVEDTSVQLSEIRTRFGSDIADLVDWLSDMSRLEDGNRATRKAMYRDRLARAPARAKAVKLADLIDNTPSIVVHDRAFAAIYLREMAGLLAVLQDAVPSCEAAAFLMPLARKALLAGLAEIGAAAVR